MHWIVHQIVQPFANDHCRPNNGNSHGRDDRIVIMPLTLTQTMSTISIGGKIFDNLVFGDLKIADIQSGANYRHGPCQHSDHYTFIY